MRAVVLLCLSLSIYAESQVALLGGMKYLDKDDWEDVNHQGTFGLQAIFGFGKDSPWGVYAALMRSSDSASGDVGVPFTVDVDITEFQGGIAAYGKPFGEDKHFVGHLAAGLAYVNASADYSFPGLDVGLSDNGFGFFLSGGLYAQLGEHVVLGPVLSWSTADVSDDVNGVQFDADAGGFVLAGALGIRW